MLPLPSDNPTDPLALADWLEINAASSADHNASRGDLESVLRVAAFNGLNDGEDIERKVLEVFFEIEQRGKAAGDAYPFELDYSGIIQCAGALTDYTAYLFCLCLSYFGLNETRVAPKLFEQLACAAAKGYLHQGESIGFGAPRTELPSSFPDAITKLCELMGEGVGFRNQSSLKKQDDKLDLVAWKDFPDARPSKLLMFGQCGAGRKWEEKLAELQPHAFWGQWIAVSSVSPTPIKSFFIPHRIDPDHWDPVARNAGILFDRCRVSYWSHQVKPDLDQHAAWVADRLANLE